mmetsp:Transcript_64697/g.140958  ORF Transcript_64697/g.140958 Transcript_64697/m.140958 type:complete len:285 (-) Transcript_64697:562-1416(-)|eukprot:CAMPEP_0170581022 /NCGR_PEP_ID=MMETSP0224-20130122/6818_1 /TAXON_ID=285029 /ORGANISM="Togula jolla, Strain CCCM 725" /LENGTH=284 /DNA_ID=CAMNT_0010904131 /DNA_START=82 /DNA_END=936 /DNA_ORIENTATION=-
MTRSWDTLASGDNFYLGLQLGHGATAKVFKCSYRGCDAAAKVLERRKSNQKAVQRELSVLKRIHHGNIVRMLGAAVSGDSVMMFMELCEGDCAFNLLYMQDFTLELAQQEAMLSQVACAMEYLHEHEPQIIHRDLKSLNVLLKKAVRSHEAILDVKLADFGLARIEDFKSASKWEAMTKTAGTNLWRAPEVSTGSYDAKVDVYSFAIFMFEVLAQEMPFEGMAIADVPQAVRGGERPDLEAIPSSVPEKMSGLMVQCWADSPRSRPSFSSIRAALQESVTRLPL